MRGHVGAAGLGSPGTAGTQGSPALLPAGACGGELSQLLCLLGTMPQRATSLVLSPLLHQLLEKSFFCHYLSRRLEEFLVRDCHCLAWHETRTMTPLELKSGLALPSAKNIEAGQIEQNNLPYIYTFQMNWAACEEFSLCAGCINYLRLIFLSLPTKLQQWLKTKNNFYQN